MKDMDLYRSFCWFSLVALIGAAIHLCGWWFILLRFVGFPVSHLSNFRRDLTLHMLSGWQLPLCLLWDSVVPWTRLDQWSWVSLVFAVLGSLYFSFNSEDHFAESRLLGVKFHSTLPGLQWGYSPSVNWHFSSTDLRTSLDNLAMLCYDWGLPWSHLSGVL